MTFGWIRALSAQCCAAMCHGTDVDGSHSRQVSHAGMLWDTWSAGHQSLALVPCRERLGLLVCLPLPSKGTAGRSTDDHIVEVSDNGSWSGLGIFRERS